MPRTSLSTLAFVLGLIGVSCSSPDPTNTKASSPTGGERDTEIKHEACDGTSSGAKRIDANSDGKPDIIHVMSGGRETCRIVDLNLDGAVDAFIYYDANGKERRRESDFDRDGRADEITILVNGVVVRKERETNFDNKLDTWDYYENGRLVRRERDSDGDKIVDQWWQFNNPTNPKCAVVATDRNADGKPDPDSVVDLCGESYGAVKGVGPTTATSAASATASASTPESPPSAAPATPSATAAVASATPSATASASPKAPPGGKK